MENSSRSELFDFGNGSASDAAADLSGGSENGNGNGGAWGSVSYSTGPDSNWTANLTTDQYLEMMLGPRQVSEKEQKIQSAFAG